MTLFELIDHIHTRGIRIDTRDGKLGITADDADLGDEVTAALKTFRKEVWAYFHDEPPAGVPGPVHALSFAQRRLYFLYHYDRSATHFNLPVELGLDGPLEVAAFQRAIQAVLERHPIYQTTYFLADGVPQQRHEPQRQHELPCIDLSDLPAQEQEARLAAARVQWAGKPFELETELPLRMALFRHAEASFSLLLVFHHIATDEWSIQRLVHELTRTYRALRGGAALPPPRTSPTYFDFVAWQQARADRGGYEAARTHWKNHLEGAPAVLELPLDRPRPAQQTYKTGLVTRPLPAPLREQVATLARQLQITEFACYLGLYHVLLNRLSGQRDLVVGVDVFGRDSAHFKDVAGFFVNQLALRTQVPVGATLRDHLAQVGRTSARALMFQDMPFEKVVDELRIERDPAYSPVFQVKFLYRRNALALDLFDGVRAWDKQVFEAQSQYDMTLQVLPDQILLHHNPDLFTDTTVRGWLDAYVALLEKALDAVDRPLRTLGQTRLAAELRPHSHGLVRPVDADSVFTRLAQAQAHPQANEQPALIAPEGTLSHAALAERLATVSAHLVALGVQRGDPVGIYLERSIDMVVAIVATLRVGAVFVPLDTDYPAQHIDDTLADSGARVVITDASRTDHLGDFCGLRLDIARLNARPPAALPPALPQGEDLAYLLYTSGSTGRPKGVQVRHASLANLCDWYIDFAHLGAGSRALLMIPIGFDAALKNVLAPLMAGATVVLAPPAPFDPQALLRLIDTTAVTALNCAPSALYALLQQDEANGYRSLRHLRVLAVGGEALDLELARPWLRSEHCHAELANIYGPTECTDISVAYKASRQEWLARHEVVIGRPIQNTQAFIVDDEGALCLPGAAGELLIAGRGVAAGYHRLPEATTERFVPSPVGDGQAYRSGDFCRHDRDGHLVYLGRRDGQIKIRGKRVEIGEVLSQLAQRLPARALSVQHYARDGFDTLVAFAAGEPPATPGPELLAELARRLPRHAVPAHIVFVPSLPLTANGKVSGPALLALYESQRTHTTAAARALTPTEATIAAVWTRLLHVPVADPHTDFFAIGGDSIFSIQVVAELRKHGFAVAVADVFRHATLAQFAALCEQRPVAATEAPEPPRTAPFALVAPDNRARLPAGLADAYPLTPLQQGMLFHLHMEPGGSVYHDVFAYDLAVEFDAPHLFEALQRVIDRHPVLRTSFDLHTTSVPLQWVHATVKAQIDYTDLSTQSERQQDDIVREAIRRLRQARFEPEAQSLIRFTVFKRHAGRIHFIIDAHHAILDGWSMATLQRQIFEQYLHLQHDTPLGDVFDSGGLQFADYVALQAHEDRDATHQAFWQAYCRACGPGALPALAAQPGDARLHSADVPPALLDQLAALTQREGLPLKNLLLVAHLHMLRLLVGGDAVTTALTDNGRPEAQGAENIAGLFLNVLPFSLDFSGKTWRQASTDVQADDVARKPHRRYPFARIAQEHRALQIDSLFTYNNFHVTDALTNSGAVRVLASEGFDDTNFKVSTLVHGNARSGLTVRLELRIDLSPREAATLLQTFMAALQCLATACDEQVPQRAGGAVPSPACVQLRHRGRFDAAALEAAVAAFALQRRSEGGETAQRWNVEPLCQRDAGSHDGRAPVQVQHSDRDGWQQLVLRVTAQPITDIQATDLLSRYLTLASDARDPTLCLEDGVTWRSWAALQQDSAFWTARQLTLPPWPELPVDHPRPAGTGRVPRQVPVRAVPGLRDLAARCGVPPATVSLAAWLLLLARLSGQTAVATAVTLADRPTFTLALDLADDPDASEWLTRVAVAWAEAMAHPWVPLAARPHDAPAGFALQPGALTHDLALQFPAPDAQESTLSGDGRLFDAATLQRLAGHLANLLHALGSEPAQPVRHLPMLDAAERQQVLMTWNDTRQDFPRGHCLHQLFEQQAHRAPEAMAVVWDDGALSYQAVNQAANQLAHGLRAQGVGPDQRVALCVERGPDLVIAVLAILKTGAAYVPLDPDHPPERLRFMLDDSRPVALLTQSHLRPRVAAPAGLPVLALDDAQRPWIAAPVTNVAAGATPGHAAYVIYTSGSTGTPKGVVVEHRHVVNLVFAHAQICALTPADRMLQFASLGFDSSVAEIFTTLSVGATLVLRPDHLRVPDAEFIDYLDRHRVTVLDLATAFWHEWAQEVRHGRHLPGPTLRLVIPGGEKAQRRHLDAWFAHPGTRHVRWLNSYGPTEATVNAAYMAYDATSTLPAHDLPIGRPIANGRFYLLDDALQPVPQGVPGEIHIGGAGVARGYLNRPALSAQRFIADPFSTDPDARLYKTGDLGRWLPDGTVEYLGRNDQQIKLRGFRIELGEIEAQLGRIDGVREAVVLLREDTPDDRQLVAYLTAQPGTSLAIMALRDHLATTLPAYMVPSAFVVLAAWPLNASGKIDRRALLAPQAEALPRRAYEAPVGAVEATLAGLWQDLLGVPQVGRQDHFFELGGHSLLAMQLASRIRQALQVEMPLRGLFDHPTLAGLAGVIATRARAAAAPITPVDRQQQGPLPLSFSQQRVWFMHELEGGTGTTYNMPAALRVWGTLDVAALRDSLQLLVQRHEVLRTNFIRVDGQPQLQIVPQRHVPLSVTEVAPHEVAPRAAAHAAQGFDLATQPLLRTELLRLSATEHVLLLNIHHIVCDGWSLDILADEWLRTYDALRQGRPPALPPLPVQYADYACWQRAQMQGEPLAQELAYWTRQLAGAPDLLNLPTDRPRQAVQGFEGGAEALTLGPALTQSLRQLGQAQGTSLFMTLLSAFAVLMSRHSGDPELLIGVPVATREQEALEGLVGLLVGNLVMRIDLQERPAFTTLLSQVRHTALDAYEHSRLPFERLVDALEVRRDLSRNPLFQVFFNMLNLPPRRHESPEIRIEGLDSTLFDAKFDLTLYAQETTDGVALDLVYNRHLFDAPRMQDLLRQFEALLRQVCAAPDATVDTHSLLTVPARAVLPDPTAVLDDRWQGSVHTRFAEVQARQPEAWAVVSHEGRWRYQELDAWSERIACWLQDQGLGLGDVVAIGADRRAGLVAAVLGVLKSGATCMILDPAYPPAHLQACLATVPPGAWLQVADHPAPTGLPALDLRNPQHCEALQAFADRRATPVAVGPDDIAVVTFTSGSTGVPKAVEGRHGALTHFFPWVETQFGLGRDDRYCLLSGLSHDPLQRDLFNALWTGGCLHVPHPDTIAPAHLAGWLRAQRISVANLTPAMLQLLCQAPDDLHLPDLRLAFIVGDVLTRRDALQLRQRAPAARLVSYYGATETQRAFGCHEIDIQGPVSEARELVPLGRGTPDVQLLVLNTQGQQAGVGEQGEIFVRSPHLARGYRGDPVLTAQRFLPNPFNPTASGDRLYRTGDLGRYLPDGQVEGLGRADQQVKLRGFRIELGHIAAVLARHPGVREVAVQLVTPRHEGPAAALLAAYVVPAAQEDTQALRHALRAHLRDTLPEPMRPAAYVWLDRLPLTPNGKLDRRALPPPGPADLGSADHAAPVGEHEALLAKVWQALLGLERVGRHDDFFEQGGHSLLVATLIERLQQEGLQVDYRTVFANPTLAAMAAALVKAEAATRFVAPPNLIPDALAHTTPAGNDNLEEFEL